MDNKNYESRMDRIIEWVRTCDTKASIMLTLVSLLVSFVFTSDYVLGGVTSIISSFLEYNPDSRSISDLSISGLLTIVALCLSVYFLLGSVYRLILVLYSKTNERLSVSQKPSLGFRLLNTVFFYKWSYLNDVDTMKESLIHFNHISNLSYQDFKQSISSSDYDEQEDFLSQIHINARRCSEKFLDYNSAITWMLGSLPCLIVFFFSLLWYSA